jgi:hypothetical protein
MAGCTRHFILKQQQFDIAEAISSEIIASRKKNHASVTNASCYRSIMLSFAAFFTHTKTKIN